MGNNTVALFLNDHADVLDRRGGDVLEALRHSMRSGCGTDQFGGPGQMQILPSCHADGQQVVVAGGNRITLLGIVSDQSHDPEKVLRELADRHGFRLVTKRP